MTESLRRETRLSLLLLLIFALYGGAVALLAASLGQLGLMQFRQVSDAAVTIWGGALGAIGVAYLLDLLLRRRPARPLAAIAEDWRTNIARPDLLTARATVALVALAIGMVFTPAKIMIGHLRGFPFDHAFIELDRTLFFGRDPWTLTHAVFGGTLPTYALQVAYDLWFVLMCFTVVWMMLRPDRVELRARYLVGYVLTWAIVGSFAAMLLASAGPCYFERAFGDPHFAPLTARLAAIDAELAARGLARDAGVILPLQNLLWDSHAAKTAMFGGGISAMPSMHVAQATLTALAGALLNRKLGIALWAYTAVIWIGSVHLGWHYAVDGIVALAMTVAIWKASGALVDRIVLAPAPVRASFA